MLSECAGALLMITISGAFFTRTFDVAPGIWYLVFTFPIPVIYIEAPALAVILACSDSNKVVEESEFTISLW